MTDPHVIRLRGPWTLEPLARYSNDAQVREQTHDLPPACKVAVPSDWSGVLGHDFLGQVRYTRPFNCPSNLEPHERVWLVLQAVDPGGQISLNGQRLGEVRAGQPAARFDITAALTPHNALSVEISLSAANLHDQALRGDRSGLAGGLPGEVWLEIGASASG